MRVVGERDRALLSTLALAADVRAGAERDVAAVQADQLGDTQPGVDGECEHGVVAAAFPALSVGSLDERAGLVAGEVDDRAFLKALGRDREHARDDGGVLGVVQRRVLEQRTDRCQPQVPGARAVVPVGCEVLQEARDQRLVEVVPVQTGGLLAGGLVDVAEQQFQGVAVGRDRARAGLQLPCQTVGKEGLQRRCDERHRRVAWASSTRRAACASSSGAADR